MGSKTKLRKQLRSIRERVAEFYSNAEQTEKAERRLTELRTLVVEYLTAKSPEAEQALRDAVGEG